MGKWKCNYETNRKYKESWENQHTWLTRSGDDEYGYCVLCKVNVLPKMYNIIAHEKTKKHMRQMPHQSYGSAIKDEISEPLRYGMDHPSSSESPNEPLVSKAMQAAAETSILLQSREDLLKSDNRNNGDISRIANDVSHYIQKDICRLLRNNNTLLKSVLCRKNYYDEKDGIEKITKTLVGHLSLRYLMDFTGPKEPEVNLLSQLNEIKKQMNKSAEEMKVLKCYLHTKEDIESAETEGPSMIMIQDLKSD